MFIATITNYKNFCLREIDFLKKEILFSTACFFLFYFYSLLSPYLQKIYNTCTGDPGNKKVINNLLNINSQKLNVSKCIAGRGFLATLLYEDPLYCLPIPFFKNFCQPTSTIFLPFFLGWLSSCIISNVLIYLTSSSELQN